MLDSHLQPLHAPIVQREMPEATEVGLLFPTWPEQLPGYLVSPVVALGLVCVHQRIQRKRCQRDADNPKVADQGTI